MQNFKIILFIAVNRAEILTLHTFPLYGAKEYTVPDHTESIGDRAFLRCSTLERIAIPDGVKAIGRSAFCHCMNLHYAAIPASVESIEHSAFQNNAKDFVIHGATGSAAERYALENNIAFSANTE